MATQIASIFCLLPVTTLLSLRTTILPWPPCFLIKLCVSTQGPCLTYGHRFFVFNIYLLHWVLVAARRIFLVAALKHLSSCITQALEHPGSVVGARAYLPWGMWALSSPARDWTCISCIGRRTFNHSTTCEVHGHKFVFCSFFSYGPKF